MLQETDQDVQDKLTEEKTAQVEAPAKDKKTAVAFRKRCYL